MAGLSAGSLLISESWWEMGQSVRFRAPAEQVVQAVTAALARRGVRLVRSFDLQAARARHPDPRDCACPQHGTAQCTCQYVVALAYPPLPDGLTAAPHVLTAHAYEQVTLVTVHSDQGSGSEDRLAVMAAVLEAAAQAADLRTDDSEPYTPTLAEP